MKLKNIVLWAALSAVPALTYGQSRAVPMLEVNPDARTAGMGGNQYGEAGSMLIYSNPTTLLYGEEVWNVSAATQIYPSEDEIGRLMYYGASLSRRFGRHGVHAGFRYLGGYSIPLDKGQDLKPADWAVDVAYTLRLLDHFSVAVGASFLRSKVVKEASAVAFNVGAYYRNTFHMGIDADYLVGINAANLGSQLDYGSKYKKNDLPAYFGGGGELGLNFNPKNRLAISLAAQYYCLPADAELFTANIGAEYTFARFVSLRAGYNYAEHDYCHLAVGAGLHYKIFRLDLAHLHGLGENEVNRTVVTVGVRF